MYVWRAAQTPDDATLLLYMHSSGGAHHGDLMYWPHEMAGRKSHCMTQHGVEPPDFLADKILVVPIIPGPHRRDKFKTPPPEDFYAMITWLHECVGRRFYACGTSRGSMWLEHGIRERPECFEAVLLTGSYANANHFSNTQHNQTVMGEALQRTPLPVISCMSPIDFLAAQKLNQMIGLAFEMLMALSLSLRRC